MRELLASPPPCHLEPHAWAISLLSSGSNTCLKTCWMYLVFVGSLKQPYYMKKLNAEARFLFNHSLSPLSHNELFALDLTGPMNVHHASHKRVTTPANCNPSVT